MPANPAGWLLATARNRAIDRLRRQRSLAEKTRLLAAREPTVHTFDDDAFEARLSGEVVIEDERLELVFTCCHPALATDAQVALTLRALGGLTTAEIGRALLVSEEAMKRRLTRAKLKIKQAAIPFSVPATTCCPIGSMRSWPWST